MAIEAERVERAFKALRARQAFRGRCADWPYRRSSLSATQAKMDANKFSEW